MVALILYSISVIHPTFRTLHPARFTFIQTQPESSRRLRSTTRDDDLAYSYRNVFGAVLKRDSRLLQELFTVEEFVLIQTNTAVSAGRPEGEWGPADSAGSLDHFFDFLAGEHTSPSRKKWELPLSASDFFEFLSAGDRAQIAQVVDYIINVLRPFCSNDPFPLATLSLFARHSKLPTPDAVHPALPFLWFVAHFILKSALALKLFREAGLLDVVEQMFLLDFPGSNRDTVRQLDIARKDMRFIVCVILGVLSAKGGYLCMARRLREEHSEFFVRVFSPFVTHYQDVNAFRLPLCDLDPPDDKRDFYNVMMEYLRYVFYPSSFHLAQVIAYAVTTIRDLIKPRGTSS